MVAYGRRMRGMHPLGWILTIVGVLVAPIVTIFLIDTMFGVAIPYTVETYLLTFAVYIVVLFVVGVFGIAGQRIR